MLRFFGLTLGQEKLVENAKNSGDPSMAYSQIFFNYFGCCSCGCSLCFLVGCYNAKFDGIEERTASKIDTM